MAGTMDQTNLLVVAYFADRSSEIRNFVITITTADHFCVNKNAPNELERLPNILQEVWRSFLIQFKPGTFTPIYSSFEELRDQA